MYTLLLLYALGTLSEIESTANARNRHSFGSQRHEFWNQIKYPSSKTTQQVSNQIQTKYPPPKTAQQGSNKHQTKYPFPETDQQGSKQSLSNSKALDLIRVTLPKIYRTSLQITKEMRRLERNLAKQGRVITLNSRRSDLSRLRNFRADPWIHKIEAAQRPFEEASKRLYKKYKFSRNFINYEMPKVNVKSILSRCAADNKACLRMITTARCNATSRYRRIDGQCNNLENPRWGSAMNCQQRLLAANYEGVSGFRQSVKRKPLPNPRRLSLKLHSNKNRPTKSVNHMYMFFGQLLDHDIALTPFSTMGNNDAIECCPPQRQTHPKCAPILLRSDDPFYSQFRQRCLNFVRSVICPTCKLGPKQVMNEVTSTIDASFVYGNSEDQIDRLRTNNGRLRSTTNNRYSEELLPQTENPEMDQCSISENNELCFEAGDPRVNQHTMLTSLQTIFHREHNRIATRFRKLCPGWSGERIFQETRRILGAQMQVITYKEYLPITLGDQLLSEYELRIGERSQYNPRIDPTTSVEFTTAAFRFAHSMINSEVVKSPRTATNQPRLLRNEFFQPFDLYRGYLDYLVEGASYSPAQQVDRHLVEDVTDYLYRTRGNRTGLDLAAININRGRDHGLPTYVETVRVCFKHIKIRRFEDLVDYGLMKRKEKENLEKEYRSVRDIDLWPGILYEKRRKEAIVGPTAACIISLQFNKLKYGDRFYFEHVGQAGSFTPKQLKELRKVTLSKIICLNTKISRLPRNAMMYRSRKNPSINCRKIRKERGINLSYWR